MPAEPGVQGDGTVILLTPEVNWEAEEVLLVADPS